MHKQHVFVPVKVHCFLNCVGESKKLSASKENLIFEEKGKQPFTKPRQLRKIRSHPEIPEAKFLELSRIDQWKCL